MLPKIYDTQLPQQLEEALNGDTKVMIIVAPTGYGKTVAIIRTMALQKGFVCQALMPYRVSVKEMHGFLYRNFDHKIGYAIHGDKRTSENDECTLYTVGYWLELFLNKRPTEPTIILLDEAHDASWQTDLALQLIIWMQRQGAPIKLIIASATLDVAHTSALFDITPLLLTVPETEPDVEVIFLKKPIDIIQHNTLSKDATTAIIKQFKQIHETTTTGDVLILLPGQREIETIAETIITPGWTVAKMYSQLSKEDLEFALAPAPQRKILLTTNMVENAVTINNLVYVIDCCVRKVSHIDHEGVQELVLTAASKSNIKQAYGRVGRQCHGYAWPMITQKQYNESKPYPVSEIDLNPLYNQLIKLYAHDIDVTEVLSRVEKARIKTDTAYLIKYGVLAQVNKKTVVTPLGNIISRLPMSIRTGKFMAEVIVNGKLPQELWYWAVLIAAWIDQTVSIFYRPGKKPDEKPEEFADRLDKIISLQNSLKKKDDLSTFLNIWFLSWTDIVTSYESPSGFKGYKAWSYDHQLYDQALKTITNCVDRTIMTLFELGFEVKIPNCDECVEALNQIDETLEKILPTVQEQFEDRVFTLVSLKPNIYKGVNTNSKYVINSKFQMLTKIEIATKVMAFRLSRAPTGKIMLHEIIVLNSMMDDSDSESS